MYTFIVKYSTDNQEKEVKAESLMKLEALCVLELKNEEDMVTITTPSKRVYTITKNSTVDHWNHPGFKFNSLSY